MEKYDLIPRQLIHEGIVEEDSFFSPQQMDEDLILSIHSEEYLRKLNHLELTSKEERRTGFPLSERLVNREKLIMQGTVDCALHALENGVSMNIAGGTHHAYSDRGEGFCLLNDLALASSLLINQKKANKVLIVDLDVHQGNGTASIFQEEPRVFTFSMHGASNYPLHKEKSDLDIALEDNCQDDKYLITLKENLTRIIHSFRPDTIAYQCGVDVLSTDKLGRLGLSIEACAERDAIVFNTARDLEIPIFAAMGGGYSEDIRHIVNAHVNTFRIASELFF